MEVVKEMLLFYQNLLPEIEHCHFVYNYNKNITTLVAKF